MVIYQKTESVDIHHSDFFDFISYTSSLICGIICKKGGAVMNENQVERIIELLESIESRLASIEYNSDSLMTSVSSVENDLDTVRTSVSDIEHVVNTISSSVSMIEISTM